MNPLRLRIEPCDAAAFERALDREQLVIGRAASVDVLLTDSLVSRQHARLYRQDDAWWIEDLGARNRTYLNDRELGGPSRVAPGDHLRFGQTLVHVLDEDGVILSDPTPLPAGLEEPVFLKTGSVVPGLPLVSSGDVEGQAARIHMLNEIHRALAAPISLSELLDLILERSFEVLRPEQGVILLRRKDGELCPVAHRRSSADTQDVPVSRRIVEEVAGKGQSALVLDAACDARFSGSDSIITSGVRSVVAAPLMDAGGALGMIALYSRVSVRQFTQQDLDLLVSLASAAALRVRNVALAEEVAARRVLEHELLLAHDIQMGMLSRTLPDRQEVSVAAALKPARSVGGDLYDFALHDDLLWFIVGDVSGKGVAAALYMAIARTLFRATAQRATSLDDVIGGMNRELVRDNDQNMFVTAIVGYLDCTTGTLLLSDAGHNPPLVLQPTGSVIRTSLRKNMALGVIDEFSFAATRMQLSPGDMLVLYTDGVTEARDANGGMYGLSRLEHALANAGAMTPGAIVKKVVGDVECFSASAAQDDDLAVLAVQYCPFTFGR